MNWKTLLLIFVIVFAAILWSRKSKDESPLPQETEQAVVLEDQAESSDVVPFEPTTSTTIIHQEPSEKLQVEAEQNLSLPSDDLPTTTTLKVKKPKAPLSKEFFVQGEKFFKTLSQKNILSREEFRSLIPYNGPVSEEEKLFSGAFQGKVPGVHQTIRFNLSYRKKTQTLGNEVCLSVRDDARGSLLVLDNDQTLRVMRTETPGYLVVLARNGIMLQLVITDDSGSLSAYLKIPNEPTKYSLVLSEKPDIYKGRRLTCKDFW